MASSRPVSLIGVPTDVGAGHRGARLGPEALRIAGLPEALAARGVDVRDVGNLQGPRNPWTAPVDGYRHLDEVVAWNRALMDATYAELCDGRMPIMLGGDHCLGMGSVTAVARWCREQGKNLRVLWLDAHADFNTQAGHGHAVQVARRSERLGVEVGVRVQPQHAQRLAGKPLRVLWLDAHADFNTQAGHGHAVQVARRSERLGVEVGVRVQPQHAQRLAGKPLRVLWLDAHSDFNTCEVTPSGNIHGMPVACLCGLGPDALTRLGGTSPAILPQQVRQIGIRSVDQDEKRLIKQHQVDVYDMRYIDEAGMKRTMEAALAGIDADTHLHVSFDVDFLDPSIAPGVGTTVPGGVNYREAQLVMEMIADTGLMGSLDIVELNPLLDRRNRTAKLAVDLVESLFGKSTLMRD
ncbi:Arginase [uncultured Stenotrophomonas sp.]|uniref:Arginase n=1 Tax=uncultured Stenotrophomonas sp. TaxID=165438 RepID=A0A1Y5Q6K2_9GAMM|nr:Arginase [uncultured Stenotrophomonas sp.]